ncbi:MAG: L-serine ammonia-lyase [Burkholderiaceae bacterium]
MLSVFDIFKIGIGPSSSHTVGPMRAGRMFAQSLADDGLLPRVASLKVDLYGSLGATGRGHATDQGVILGLLGEAPDTVDPAHAAERLARVRRERTLALLDRHPIAFNPRRDIAFLGQQALPRHPNAMRLAAFDANGALLREADYFSVGGGFIVEGSRETTADDSAQQVTLPYPFDSGNRLIALTRTHQLSIAQLVMANECQWRTETEVRDGLLRIWRVMQDCVRRGLGIDNAQAGETLPGGLRLRRRAPSLYQRLSQASAQPADPLAVIDWVNAFAMAVNEENAAGGRVVTAPTNGAAGIIPAVLHYYERFVPGANEDGVIEFLLTAGAIGVLYKTNASISGAEVGCQGEVGVACSMAAAALTAAQGGSPGQVENAAEIGMEHNLGLTCDPVGGLVQIPCVERNAMGAVKAINASRMALNGDGTHNVSLDTVIRTMKQTGEDMKSTYKETSLGGLAVNVVEC